MRSLKCMMNFKNKSGFTLIEVLLALALVGLTIMPILNLQSIFFSAIDRASRNIQAAFQAKEFLIRSLFELDAVSKDQEDPLFQANYQKVKIPAISVLQNIDNLTKNQVTVSWQGVRGAREKELVCFWVEKPEVEKK